MKRFATLVGRFPLAGKIPIKPIVFCLYQSTSRYERTYSYTQLLVLLLLLIALHLFQVWIAYTVLASPTPVWVQLVSVLYILANGCVIMAQAHLWYRATAFYFSGTAYRQKMRTYRPHSEAEVQLMLGVTFGIQILFYGIYTHFQ